MNEITVRAFFGDRERAFALTDPMLAELERITGLGSGALFFQMASLAYPAAHLREIIRLGLIGGGETSPEEAKHLCDTYATNRPVAEVLALAGAIMTARWFGTDDEGETPEEVHANAVADFDRFAAQADAA